MTMLSASLVDATSTVATTCVEQCRAQIDKDLAALAESMHALRSSRNGLAYISSLPPEILANVFRHFVEEGFESYTSRNRCHGAPTCLIVTHICRRWRQVALECPTLWSSISYVSPRWLAIMLERSKNAALVVTYNTPVSLYVYLEQILLQLPRIKVLQFRSRLCDVNPVLDLLSSRPAPLLQIFKFSVSETNGPYLKSLPDTIFQGQAPQLWSVELTWCRFSPSSRIFHGLRTLRVGRGRGNTSYPAPQLLSALRHMPSLEQLTLEQLALEHLSIIIEEAKLFDKLPLPRLKRISLDATTIKTAVYLFAHLALPIDVKISLRFERIEGPHNFSDLFLAMEKDYNGSEGSRPVVRSLYAVCMSHCEFGVQFSTSMTPNKSGYSAWNPCDDDIRLSIQFRCNTDAEVDSTIIFDICRIVTQGRIQNLILTSSFYLRDHFWYAGSADLPELEVIHLSRIAIEGLITALHPECAENSDIAYPSLRVLDLEQVDFEYGESENLQDAIKKRAEDGIRLHELRLTKCTNLKLDEVRLFEEVVGNVDWDGHEESTGHVNRYPHCTWDFYDSDEDLEDLDYTD